MADPNNPIHPTDIHYEHRGGDCFTLVDPTMPEGRRDIASTWCERGRDDVWRWRLAQRPFDGTPYPTALSRDQALDEMLAAYAAEPGVADRIKAQSARHSFGAPQIVRATLAA